MTFETERLIVRPLELNDRDSYYEMMSNPNVMNPIPRAIMNRKESDEHLEKHLVFNNNSTVKVLAITLKENKEFIGICAYLKNDLNEDEIGYRLLEKHWGVGYGTELTKGLIDNGFKTLGFDVITADVKADNTPSVKILEKYFKKEKEFYNHDDQCTDSRYKLTRKEWL